MRCKGFHCVVPCGAKGIRTPDPLHAMEMRYQLRHSPVFNYLTRRADAQPNQGEILKQAPHRGAKGIRTPDPLHAMEMRYQLRHSPVFNYLTRRADAQPNQGEILKQAPHRGAKGIRTPDPLHAMEMRYQLRHSPVFIYQLFANLVYNTTECQKTQNKACRTRKRQANFVGIPTIPAVHDGVSPRWKKPHVLSGGIREAHGVIDSFGIQVTCLPNATRLTQRSRSHSSVSAMAGP